MSRIKHLVRPEAEPHNWKRSLPILGLAACAALYAWAAPAHAAQGEAARKEARVLRVAAGEEPYAMVRRGDKGFNISGSSDDWDDVKAAQRVVQGDFLWFREGGKSYVIQDPEVMARANAAWAPVDRLGKQMDVHGKEMDKHGKKMDALGREMQQAADGARFPELKRAEMREVEAGMRALGAEMETLGRQMAETRDDAERERIQRRMNDASERMSAAGKRIAEAHDSAQQRKARAEMEAIGRKMKEAGKPMESLGKQMGELGKQMERESKAADTTVRGLIRDARARGLARAVPAAG
jgi:hypothetical protein